jgi:multidrug efflux pump subunit AcrA (membrane-fusion protein)
MEDKSKLFSQAALDKLRSPEKLDMMLPITTPVGWMGLAAIALLLLSVVLWSIFGSFTVRAEGMGLIMDSGGLVNVTHTAGGKIAHLHVREGEQVKKGSLIAQMEQAEQSADVHMAQYSTQLGESMKDTAQRAYQYKNKMYQQEIARDIISDYDGVVDQVLVEPGSYVSGGTPLVTVRQTRKRSDLRGVLFIPVNKGKRLEPGQSVQLVPGGVDVQESGSLLGVVRKVSDYPVPLQRMVQELGNREMAQWIYQAEGAVMEVEFDLVKDESSESGYLWTSFVGEHKPITAGSFVTGTVIIERRPPIEKVFYRLSQWLRNR